MGNRKKAIVRFVVILFFNRIINSIDMMKENNYYSIRVKISGCLLMQVLKDEVKEKIIEVAVVEFRDKGFNNASMRIISKNAGMTVGNLYRYFKHKEDLFYTIVTPAYDRLMFLARESIEYYKVDAHMQYIEHVTDWLLRIYRECRNELIILFEGSSGTKYANTKAEIISLVEEFQKEIIAPKLRDKGIVIEDMFLFHIISSGFIEGLFMIAKHYDDEVKTRKVVSQFIEFYFNDMFKRFN